MNTISSMPTACYQHTAKLHNRTVYVSVVYLLLAFSCSAQKVDYDKKLKDLGIQLPTPSKPVANYVKAVRVGNLLFLSGHGPDHSDGSRTIGKVGADLTIEQGYAAAKLTAEGLLATMKIELGDLNRVKRIVKVNGWVNCPPEFGDQPKVINGCSDLMVAVFGEKIGKHARAAMGAGSLPFNQAVEIEMVVEVE
ncbi:RidA family protein [Chryseolinea sp. T2]|uniref:RidA family protein n=1 Tax=Chryseolinea sp. T2 TaxID=3129255 RepID=UPI003077D7F0